MIEGILENLFIKVIWKLFEFLYNICKTSIICIGKKLRNVKNDIERRSFEKSQQRYKTHQIEMELKEISDELYVFESIWKDRIPDHTARISFIKKFMQFKKKEMTQNQYMKWESMDSRVCRLYSELYQSKHITKKEKNLYKIYLDILENEGNENYE